MTEWFLQKGIMTGWKNHKERNKGRLHFLTSEYSFYFSVFPW